MNEEAASKLLTIAGPLLGVVVGGLISALSTWGLEHRRWRRNRSEKLEALRRDALTAALEWIEPMRNAESHASSLVMAVIRGDVDDEQFLEEFPYLIGDLAKKDLSASLRAILPDDGYSRGHEIVRNLEELRFLGVRFSKEARLKGQPIMGFQECSAKLDHIGKLITALETDLRKAFYDTFV
jgi:hypothetical protein